MSKQRIVSNLLVVGTGQLATWALTFVYFALIGHYLGPFRFGELALATAITQVLGLTIKFGMDTLITRTVARAPERAGVLASAAMMVRSILTLPGFAVLYAWAHLACLNMETREAAYILYVGVAVASFGGALLATFQGREEMKLNATWAVAQKALNLVFAGLIVWRGGGVVAFATTTTLTEFLLLAMNLRLMRRFGRLTWRPSAGHVREVIVGGLAFYVNEIFFTIYLYIDSVILAALAGTQAVGYYGPATRLFSTALFVTTIIGPATLPLLSRLGVDAGADFVRVGRKTLSLLIVTAVPLTIGLATFAGPLILTVYGPRYGPSVPVLIVLCLCILPMCLNSQFSQTLTASNQQWRWTLAIGVGCVVNPLLNVALVPLAMQHWHNGALGAAVALVISEVMEVIYGAVLLRRMLFDRALGRVVVASLVAGAAQGAVVGLWLHAAPWPPVGEAMGAAIYAAVALALGAVPRDDVMLLYHTVMSRTRGLHRLTDPRTTAAERTPPVN